MMRTAGPRDDDCLRHIRPLLGVSIAICALALRHSATTVPTRLATPPPPTTPSTVLKAQSAVDNGTYLETSTVVQGTLTTLSRKIAIGGRLRYTYACIVQGRNDHHGRVLELYYLRAVTCTRINGAAWTCLRTTSRGAPTSLYPVE